MLFQHTDAVAKVRLGPGPPNLVTDVRPGVAVLACLEICCREHDYGIGQIQVGIDLLLWRPNRLRSRFVGDDEATNAIRVQQRPVGAAECSLLPFGAADEDAACSASEASTRDRP